MKGRNKDGTFKNGNPFGKIKQKPSKLKVFLNQNEDKLVRMAFKQAKDNPTIMLYLLSKKFGKKIDSDFSLPVNSSSSEMLQVLIKNSSELPIETLEALLKLVEANTKIAEMDDLKKSIQKFHKRIKKSKKGKSGWK